MDRDEFFAELDGLTEKEIEAHLPIWDREQLALVQEYLEQKGLQRARGTLAAQNETSTQEDAVRLSLEVARRAHTTAMMAFIVSMGAMLAAIAASVLAFLALRGATISW
jgi:hypothetical protein